MHDEATTSSTSSDTMLAATTAAMAEAVTPEAMRQLKKTMRKTIEAKLRQMSSEEIKSQSHSITQSIIESPTYQRAQRISIFASMSQGEVDTSELCDHILRSKKRLYLPIIGPPRYTQSPSSGSEDINPATVRVDAASSSSSRRDYGSNFMRMLQIQDEAEWEHMYVNKWGIREPGEYWTSSAGVDEAEKLRVRREDALDAETGGAGLDLIISPGVAFDDACGRLGHGKGFYDRYFAEADEFAKSRGKEHGPVLIGLCLRPQLLPPGANVPMASHDRPLDAIITPDMIIRPSGRRDHRTHPKMRSTTTTMQKVKAATRPPAFSQYSIRRSIRVLYLADSSRESESGHG